MLVCKNPVEDLARYNVSHFRLYFHAHPLLGKTIARLYTKSNMVYNSTIDGYGGEKTTMQTSSMPDLRIRNLPPALHKDLKRLALEEDTSLQALVIEILKEAVARAKQEKR